MPCDSSYMNATPDEVALSKLCCFIDEINGVPYGEFHPDGYHPRAYNTGFNGSQCRALADEWTSELCARLRKSDVTKYSLELQIWWRDHQIDDKDRERRVQAEKEQRIFKESALAKLTDEEKIALGLGIEASPRIPQCVPKAEEGA